MLVLVDEITAEYKNAIQFMYAMVQPPMLLDNEELLRRRAQFQLFSEVLYCCVHLTFRFCTGIAELENCKLKQVGTSWAMRRGSSSSLSGTDTVAAGEGLGGPYSEGWGSGFRATCSKGRHQSMWRQNGGCRANRRVRKGG